MQWSDKRMGKMHPITYILNLQKDNQGTKIAMNERWMAQNVFHRCGYGNRASLFLDEAIGTITNTHELEHPRSKVSITFIDGSNLYTDSKGTIDSWYAPKET